MPGNRAKKTGKRGTFSTDTEYLCMDSLRSLSPALLRVLLIKRKAAVLSDQVREIRGENKGKTWGRVDNENVRVRRWAERKRVDWQTWTKEKHRVRFGGRQGGFLNPNPQIRT